jgi:GAF domain-containing protein
MLTRGVVAIPDVLEDPEYRITSKAIATGFRSALAVPLLRDGSPIGAIIVGWLEPGPFPDQQITLLQTFADQAVIAIENVRLFNEHRRERSNRIYKASKERVACSPPLATAELFALKCRADHAA